MSQATQTPLEMVHQLVRLNPLIGGRVERVEVDRSCQVTVLLNSAEGPKWYRLADDGLTLLDPSEDQRLPLVARLAKCAGKGAPRLISYRPGRRIVLECTENQLLKIVKGFRASRLTAAVNRHRIASVSADSEDGFRVPRLLEVLPERAAMVLEWVDGSALDCSPSGEDQFFVLGTALGDFQSADIPADLVRFGPHDELGVLDQWAQRVEWVTGHLPPDWSQTRAVLDEFVVTLPSVDPVLCHRDLHDGQILVTAGGLVLMDFDLLCRGDRELDAGNLLAHLSLRSLQGIGNATEKGALACGSALLDGLGCQDDPGFWRRLRFYEATTFLRLSLVYSLRPRWVHLRGDLIKLAKRCTGELQWID